MIKWIVLAVLVFTALSSVWGFLSSRDYGVARNDNAPSTANGENVDRSVSAPDARSTKSASSSIDSSATKRFRVPDSFLPSPFATATRINGPYKLMALTREEKVWLDKNEFPTLTEVEWAKQVTVEELKNAAQTSLAMAALYGERLWEEGRYEEGKDVIWDAVVRGSIYAAEVMALRILKDGAVWPDGANAAAFEAAGWWFYAGQRGDYYVSEDIGNYLSASKGLDFASGFRRALEIGMEVDAARAKLGLPPASRDARPSYEEYVEGKSQQEVTVIPR